VKLQHNRQVDNKETKVTPSFSFQPQQQGIPEVREEATPTTVAISTAVDREASTLYFAGTLVEDIAADIYWYIQEQQSFVSQVKYPVSLETCEVGY
jgi:hypothetical protein